MREEMILLLFFKQISFEKKKKLFMGTILYIYFCDAVEEVIRLM